MSSVNPLSPRSMQVALPQPTNTAAAIVVASTVIAPAVILAEKTTAPAPIAGRGSSPVTPQSAMPRPASPAASVAESKALPNKIPNIESLLSQNGLKVSISFANPFGCIGIFKGSCAFKLATITQAVRILPLSTREDRDPAEPGTNEITITIKHEFPENAKHEFPENAELVLDLIKNEQSVEDLCNLITS